jgi:alpha-ribazole phosphatase/probable phosphoglycerate mutase
MLPETHIELLRHGEPAGGRRYRGTLDDPLSDLGWAQMRARVADRTGWDAVISSPLQRCREFAMEIAAKRELPLLVVPELQEIGFGDWEGLTADEVHQRDPNALRSFWADPVNNTPPGAEPLTTFHQRITAVWEQLLQARRGEKLLLVAHAGVIRICLMQVLKMPLDAIYRLDIPYAGLSQVVVSHDKTKRYYRLSLHG